MKVAEYIAATLADRGVKHVFLLTGGGAMFLNDAFAGEPRIEPVCCHHEQACAMAAEGYARLSGKIGVVNVTTGPGGINALNGVFGAWTDSIPLLVVSGQVKRETCMASHPDLRLRQLGDQEADILAMARGITKYAALVDDPARIRYHLERALHLAVSGRPGPCWLDVPIDVQSAAVDPAALEPYDPVEDPVRVEPDNLRALCRDILVRLANAERPVILAGTGVRLAGAADLFHRVVHRLGVPVTTAWTHDLIASDDPLFCGRPGTIGTRAGNFTVQNADVLLVLGSRLNIRQVSYNWPSFAREAFKIQVDVDPAELAKPTVKPDLAVVADLGAFLRELDRQLAEAGWDPGRHAGWLAWCRERVERYPAVRPEHREFRGAVNPYGFVEALFAQLADDDAIVTANGAACVVTFQAARLKRGQRLFSNSGNASMGYDLPAAVGAAVARGGKRVICLAGDGSIQLNIQELATVARHRLPVKIFVFNNDGYLSIRLSQANFFGRFIGESSRSGLFFPDLLKVAGAYGIAGLRIEGADYRERIGEALAVDGPVLAEVILDPAQAFEPRMSSRSLPDGRIVSAPLEDMFPFLDREELARNLRIAPLDGM
jgi:acetolactate synthase I/II/III large subunit